MRLRLLCISLTIVLAAVSVQAEERVRVRLNGRVVVVPLEQYVSSTVASETYASWPLEALKAQAVVARTYALHERRKHASDRYDLESTVISQRYGTAKAAPRIRRATQETQGQYLSFRGAPILAVFHASAGGRTASSREVWGEGLPYLTSVASPDDAAPDHFWSYEMPETQFIAALREAGVPVAGPAAIAELDRSRSGRVRSVEIGGEKLSGRDLRKILGGRAIRSALFDLRSEDGRVLFLGSGAGHGVGLSQWGARELARQGKPYRSILAHYYPGTTLRGSGDRDPQWSASE